MSQLWRTKLTTFDREQPTAHRPEEYLAIMLWGQQMLSFMHYIQDQQELAAEDGAPVDAIYKKFGESTGPDNKWVCVSDLAGGHHFRADYETMLDKAKEKKDAS